jgi:hypothetical protein
MACSLPNRLLMRYRRGESKIVPHASPTDLGHFRGERSKCHDNVDRWCQAHPNDLPVRGWLATDMVLGAMFERHSIINRSQTGLLDITPMSDRTESIFLIHDGSQEEFNSLPNQVISTDPGLDLNESM